MDTLEKAREGIIEHLRGNNLKPVGIYKGTYRGGDTGYLLDAGTTFLVAPLAARLIAIAIEQGCLVSFGSRPGFFSLKGRANVTIMIYKP